MRLAFSPVSFYRGRGLLHHTNEPVFLFTMENPGVSFIVVKGIKTIHQ
jgi:hypothetical protein